MPYPRRFLSTGEEVVSEFHPHWASLIRPTLAIVGLVVVGVLLGAFVDTVDMWAGVLGGLVLGIIVTMPRWVKWKTTWFVITTERLIVRTGLFTRTGKEIPLEVINDVAFGQTIGERIFRSGDLLVESAGEHGQSRFTDIPDPEGVQALIYKVREERTLLLRGNTSVGSELETLARLRGEGVITDEEFEQQKARLLGR